ncbi:unnamed protein product [Dibothriocephalus latus]|uniref:Uncharacterized protein n=1 Tax=Dibothriocephalus latus TaxID=60516 RepID=A0A3P7NID0_DIBLA|nr:unnamed protein product [Dibothriocephalus latus]
MLTPPYRVSPARVLGVMACDLGVMCCVLYVAACLLGQEPNCERGWQNNRVLCPRRITPFGIPKELHWKPPGGEFIVYKTHRLLLVLLGSLATAAQMIVEEVFLKKHGFHALHVVGMEGFFGMFVMGFVSCPLYTARRSYTDTLFDGFQGQLATVPTLP